MQSVKEMATAAAATTTHDDNKANKKVLSLWADDALSSKEGDGLAGNTFLYRYMSI